MSVSVSVHGPVHMCGITILQYVHRYSTIGHAQTTIATRLVKGHHISYRMVVKSKLYMTLRRSELRNQRKHCKH